jgi:hypothetical protein
MKVEEKGPLAIAYVRTHDYQHRSKCKVHLVIAGTAPQLTA